jgi:adenylosuccinate synthase
MDIRDYYRCEPQYEKLDGWKQSIRGVKRHEDLPANAKKYLARLEELTGARIDIISTGPERESTIILRNPFSD